MKCIAVSPGLRDEGLCLMLISHLISTAQSSGISSLKVYTKPSNEHILASASFHTIARAPEAILMENGYGLEQYCDYLKSLRRPGTGGIVVMNANPFTLGHQYLVEQAARHVDNLYVILVAEDCSQYPYSERLHMVKAGCRHVPNVVVCPGSSYAVSAATFPTYFLKKIEDATSTHIMLDLDLYTRHIAPALGATQRWVGSEPSDASTRLYNETMKSHPGINLVEVPRTGNISASRVRKATSLQAMQGLVPGTTLPHVIADMATRALLAELDATPKPGLVDRHDNGAHHDMDYPLMSKSIEALRPYFVRLALMGYSATLPAAAGVRQVGLEAERAMLAATGGVNTHKGALFSMGLAVAAAAHQACLNHRVEAQPLQQSIVALASQLTAAAGTHGAAVASKTRVRGALAMAQAGYEDLFDCWLPFLEDNLHDDNVMLKTLLLIMSQLDDTNVYYRRGAQVAMQVKEEAGSLLRNFSIAGLEQMNRECIAGNISPGGAADMLSLTCFIHTIVR